MHSVPRLIIIEGRFDDKMANNFKNSLKQCLNNSEVRIRINSYGGNTWALTKMRGYLYFMAKYKKCRFIAEIELAESSALLFAVSMNTRRIMKTSRGSIHLPESTTLYQPTTNSIYEDFIQVYLRRTSLLREDVIALNGSLLTSAEMLQYGIATEVVEKF